MPQRWPRCKAKAHVRHPCYTLIALGVVLVLAALPWLAWVVPVLPAVGSAVATLIATGVLLAAAVPALPRLQLACRRCGLMEPAARRRPASPLPEVNQRVAAA